MTQRIAALHPGLPAPVVAKLLAQDAGELDLRITHPEALGEQVRSCPLPNCRRPLRIGAAVAHHLARTGCSARCTAADSGDNRFGCRGGAVLCCIPARPARRQQRSSQ